MTALVLTPIVLVGSLAAGFLGALTGLGGGVVIVPLLVLIFGVDIHYAIGASLVAVIATSSGSAAAYVRDGYTNVRIAMLLEVATVAGALCGAWLARYTPGPTIAVIFGVVVLYTAVSALKPPAPRPLDERPDPLATLLKLNGSYPADGGIKRYYPHRVPWGFLVMLSAGALSALLGIGSGIVKVLAMDRLMRLPFKVSTTTSNFMIGVTAAASAGVYLHRGQIEPGLAMPVALGALGGSFLGAKTLPRIKTKTLRMVFAVVVSVAAVQMMYKAATGKM